MLLVKLQVPSIIATLSQLENIGNETRDIIEEWEMDYSGVTAYSSLGYKLRSTHAIPPEGVRSFFKFGQIIMLQHLEVRTQLIY